MTFKRRKKFDRIISIISNDEIREKLQELMDIKELSGSGVVRELITSEHERYLASSL